MLGLGVSAGGLGGCKKRRVNEWPSSMHTTTAESASALVQRGKGDVVLLVLYASWCSGCRAELPDVDRVGLKYEGKGLRVVALSLDEDPQDFGELVADQKLHFDLVRVAPMDNKALVRSIGVLGGSYGESIPYAALFDRTGKLTREWKDGSAGTQLETAVTSLL
jgi:thiol-disulfide isomerase/thioredoxin